MEVLVTNFMDRTKHPVSEAVEEKEGRWFVKMGFAGFNSRANNGPGFARKAGAMKSVKHHEGIS